MDFSLYIWIFYNLSQLIRLGMREPARSPRRLRATHTSRVSFLRAMELARKARITLRSMWRGPQLWRNFVLAVMSPFRSSCSLLLTEDYLAYAVNALGNEGTVLLAEAIERNRSLKILDLFRSFLSFRLFSSSCDLVSWCTRERHWQRGRLEAGSSAHDQQEP